MMDAREFKLSRLRFAATVAALFVGCWTGCSTLAVKGAKTDSQLGGDEDRP